MDSRDAPASSQPDEAAPTGAPAGTAPSPETRVELLAAEYLERIQSGTRPALDAFAEQLPSSSEQEQFRRLVGEVLQIEGMLPQQLAPGVELSGRYRLFREVGAGGMGRVFEALDTKLKRRVAVKVLSTFAATTVDGRELFEKESTLLAALRHPQIVAVHEAGSDGDVHFAVMDLIRGASLADVLERVRQRTGEESLEAPRQGTALREAVGHPVPDGSRWELDESSWFRSAAGLTMSLARAIEAAHGQGVIHRDLKPGNVMLRGDGVPVVLDFGLAGQLDQTAGTITRGLFGSPAYLAPEQARDQRAGCDPRTDVYQLGVLLYELLTLRQAFDEESVVALLDRIARGEFRRPRSVERRVPAELEAICLRAMELEPARRYQSARDLADDLERYMSGLEAPLAARGGAVATALRDGRYFVRRHRSGLAAAAVLLAALCVGGLWPEDEAQTQVRAFASAWTGDLDTVAAETRRLHDGGLIRPGELLGVVLKAEEPQYVYALSVFGTEDEPRRYVSPMRPLLIASEGGAEGAGDGGSADSDQAEGWSLAVGVGAHTIGCSALDEEDYPAELAYEGLWVFHSSRPQEQLESWFGRLASLGAMLDGGVPFDRAWREFNPRTRGRPVSAGDMTDERRQALLTGLTSAQLLGEAEWPLDDPVRFEIICRVEP